MSGSEPNQGLWTEEESSTQTSQDDILKMEEDEDFDEHEIEATETESKIVDFRCYPVDVFV